MCLAAIFSLLIRDGLGGLLLLFAAHAVLHVHHVCVLVWVRVVSALCLCVFRFGCNEPRQHQSHHGYHTAIRSALHRACETQPYDSIAIQAVGSFSIDG